MGRNTCYNLVTFIAVVLGLTTCIVSSVWLRDPSTVPEVLQPATDIPIPTARARSFFTPSVTPTASDTPAATFTRTPTTTWTATSTQTPTLTPTATVTDTPSTTPSFTPSSTITPSITPSITLTPSLTFTPSITPTNTPTPTATGPTATPMATTAPFPFEVPAGGLRIRQNLNQNCAFQGFAGNVFDLLNEPIEGLQIVATGPGLPGTGSISSTGGAPQYGAGGWQIQVASTLTTNTYTVQLRDQDGTILSAPVTVTFSGACEENLILISFRQLRPYP